MQRKTFWLLLSSYWGPCFWHLCHVFPLFGDCMFPALGVDCGVSLTWHHLHFSRPWHRFTRFPRPASIAFFLHLAFLVSRFPCFPRLAAVTGFSALGSGYMFSGACHWLHLSRALHWLGISRAWHRLLLVLQESL